MSGRILEAVRLDQRAKKCWAFIIVQYDNTADSHGRARWPHCAFNAMEFWKTLGLYLGCSIFLSENLFWSKDFIKRDECKSFIVYL